MDAKKISINGNRYIVEPLNPHDALAWIVRMRMTDLGLGGPGTGDPEKATRLLDDAIARCWTPENERLSDPEVYNRWFQKHPLDLLPLGMQACTEVASDFLARTAAISGNESPTAAEQA